MHKLLFAVLCLGVISVLSGCSDPVTKAAKKMIGKEDDLSDEEFARLKNMEGLQACSQGNYANAASLFKQCVERDEKTEYYGNLGRCYYWLGRYSDALRAYAKAEELGGTNPGLDANIGDVFRQRKDYTEAISYYHKALSANPDFARAQYELGNLYLKQGQYDDAEKRLNRALSIDPGYNKALLARLILFRLTRQYEKAYVDLKSLDRKGYDIQPDLKHEILVGVKKMREEKPYPTDRL